MQISEDTTVKSGTMNQVRITWAWLNEESSKE